MWNKRYMETIVMRTNLSKSAPSVPVPWLLVTVSGPPMAAVVLRLFATGRL